MTLPAAPPHRPKTVHIKSFGCQMNVYDAARMADILRGLGYAETAEAEGADLVILNTCHIREKAAEKVYSDLGRLRQLKHENGKALIAVAGCVAQAEGAEIMRRAPVVELVFGPQTYHRLPSLLGAVEREREKTGAARVLDTEFPSEEKFGDLPKARQASPSAFLTIQEGCDKFCTFCVVPYTRGAEFSRPLADVLAEAERLAAGGAKEIMLLGQNVNAYRGRDEGGKDASLAALIRRLAVIPGLQRIRYTTSHPRDVSEEQIAVHAEIEACMPYLHLPVQSGSDKILRAMKRRHRARDYIRTIEKFRKARPDIAISGDFIVGFPGETEKDFAATLRLAADVNYAQAYSFKYSPRPGTPAAEAEQTPEPVKAGRLQRLQSLLDRQQQDFNAGFVGRSVEVLFEREGKREGQAAGRTPHLQAVHVSLGSGPEGGYPEADSGIIGSILPVEIVSAGPNSLEGRLKAPRPARTAA
ncbi:MAG TPA: tRNA (N6-isopentenyl adenosine(37)-C2)-methylthiotransferase MiaB [Sphingomonadales bacterium]|nr:tRNA (N6-isopentenyl adenosine(37)-C2)-methylthiotransferase MiaB [Sphingomonadales bacterium]